MSMQSQTGRKIYRANLTQASTAAPVATVLENDFGDVTLTWGYTSTGLYTLTASLPIFTSAKTSVKLAAFGGIATVALTSTTVITITTKSTGTDQAAAVANALLSATEIEISVNN